MYLLRAQQADFAWAKQFSGASFEFVDEGETDSAGNVVSLGRFSSSIDLDPGPAVNTVSISNGNAVFMTKVDPNGDFIWGGILHANIFISAYALTLDQHANVYVAGQFEGAVDFDIGPGVNTVRSITNDGDMFIAKYSAAGNLIWVKTTGGLLGERIWEIRVDKMDNIYFSGRLWTTIDFDPGPSVFTFSPFGSSRNAFLCKWDQNGDFVWAKVFQGAGSIQEMYLAVDYNLDIILAGSFIGTIDFDPDSSSVHNLSTGFNQYDGFVVRLSPAGSFIWAKEFNASSNSARVTSASSVAIDDWGNIFFGGDFQGTVDFNPGSATLNLTPNPFWEDNLFIVKLRPNGDLAWAKEFRSGGDNTVGEHDVDHEGSVYITGGIESTTDFDPGSGVANLMPTQGSEDIFIAKLDSSGQYVWAKLMGGAQDQRANYIDVAPDYSLSVGGQFKGTADFDFSSNIFNMSAASSFDGFIVRLHPACSSIPPQRDSLHIQSCGSYTSPSQKYIWSQNGIYFDTLLTTIGCEKYLWIDLHILPSFKDTIFAVSCEEYISPSGTKIWKSSGVYIDTLSSQTGCDSLIQVNLTIYPTSVDSLKLVTCGNYTSPSGKIWRSSGMYKDTLPNALGCDSIFIIELDIKQNTFFSYSTTTCDSLISPSKRYTWKNSGTYYDTLLTQYGCDSTIEVQLIVNSSYKDTVMAFACGYYLSPSGNFTWSSSGIYTETLQLPTGCDSTVIVNLTIAQSNSAVIQVQACDAYISPSGKFTWTQSGVYNDTILNQAGCDSLITINLNIDEVDTNVTRSFNTLEASAPNSNYQWIYCDSVAIAGAISRSFTPFQNGSYAVIVSQNGCTDTSSCYLINQVSVDENSFANQIHIFPNPTSSHVEITLGARIKGVEVTVFNALGKEVVETYWNQASKINVDLPEMSGIYFIQLGTVSKVLTA